MKIDSLRLENFRNYKSPELDFSSGSNLFYGDNAQGKTNILEAVYFCGTTRSHRTSRDRDLICFGQEGAHLRMELVSRGQPYRIDVHLKNGRAKGIAINSIPIRRAQELVGLGSFIFFSPEDLSIIKNGPSERRRFLDMELCQLSRVYMAALSSYNKVLMQRNRLLRDLAFSPQDIGTLDVWDEQLVRYGSEVIRFREKFVLALDDVIRPIHFSLSSGRENLSVLYEKNTDAEAFEEKLRKGRERDLFMKTTETGPHRDDLGFRIFSPEGNENQIDLRRFGSQGQQRSSALSLKLAEIRLVKEQTGDVPVLLLDDVLSELDSGRQRDLLNSIGDIQTFITCTGLSDYERNHFRIDRSFYVKDGCVESM